MAKVRVYELAKELGVESKVVLAKLQDMGEFVRSASSTVEPPVVRKLKEVFPAAPPAAEKAPFGRAVRQRGTDGGGWLGWVVSVTDLEPVESCRRNRLRFMLGQRRQIDRVLPHARAQG